MHIGLGLDRNIKSAYGWLCRNYHAGDSLYLFGSSRGAYTARSLAGMVTRFGLLDPAGLNESEIWKRIHDVFDKGYRVIGAKRQAFVKKGYKFKRGDARSEVSIQFIGVWDTVGELGVPEHLGLFNVMDDPRKHRFHDTELNELVKHARHALTLEETQAGFEPSLWTSADGRDVKQVWFSGTHREVEDHGRKIDAANASLIWMLNEAKEQGLGTDPDAEAQIKVDQRDLVHETSASPSDHEAGFRLMDFIEVAGPDGVRRIALYHGDLTELPEPVDFLVISAFPEDYVAVPGTVIGSLASKGVSVAELAARKEHDLRQSCGFWVSEDLSASHPQLHARRLLCFEPGTIGVAPQVVGEIFRGMFPFLKLDGSSSVAMSLIGAGSQRWEPHQIFRPLLESAMEWLRRGLPLNELKIVVRSRSLAEKLGKELAAIKVTKERGPVGKVPTRYDVFLSYSSLDTRAVRVLKDAIQEASPGVRIFDFKYEIEAGKSYQNEIDQAIESCGKIVAVMTPSYFTSPECQEELQIARLRNKRSGHSVLFPVRPLRRCLRI